MTVAEALENIYAALAADNAGIDDAIRDAKAAMVAEGVKELVVQPERLAQNNRQGRKTMQSYFRKKGISVSFAG